MGDAVTPPGCCKRCGAPVLVAPEVRTGVWRALSPDPAGPIGLLRSGAWQHLSPLVRPEWPRAARYVPHRLVCAATHATTPKGEDERNGR